MQNEEKEIPQQFCFVCYSLTSERIIAKESTMFVCTTCGAQWQDSSSLVSPETLYSENYYKKIWGYSSETDALVGRSKHATSQKMIAFLHQYCKGGTVLDVGCGLGYLLSFLQQDSFAYDAYGVELSSFGKDISEKRIGKGKIFSSLADVKEHAKKKNLHFDAILFFDSMEHIPHQQRLFQDIHQLLKPNGVALAIMPDPSSWISQVMGRHWIEYKKDHVLFYSKKALQLQLEQKEFQLLFLSSTWKTVTLYYLIHYLSVFRIPVVSSVLVSLERYLPFWMLNLSLSLPIGQMIAVFSPKNIK